jgi:hypothetical protein
MIKFGFGRASREPFNRFSSGWLCRPANTPTILISVAPVGESSQAVDAAAISRI